MEVRISNNIIITDPTPQLKQWCKDNLIITNPDYVKKKRMGFWLGNTPQYLYLYSVDGDDWILPFGTLREILPEIQFAKKVTKEFKPATVLNYGEPISLYDYQEEALYELKKANYGILRSKAGSGKTRIGLALIKAYGLKALWLTHTFELLNQSMSAAKEFFDNTLLGKITEGKVEIGKGITFATVQTMSSLNLDEYKHEWDIIIVDECHRVAGTPTAVTMFSKVLNSLSARHKYGLSATVHRADGMIKATYALLGGIVHNVPDEAVGDKTMAVKVEPVYTSCRMTTSCLNSDGTINYAKMINHLCENDDRSYEIVEQIIENENHSCLILSDRLGHLESMRSMLPETMFVYSSMVSGKMTSKKAKEERKEIIEKMKNGELRYLFATYSLAKEGLDIPRLDRLFLATPQTDYAIITQAIGRIARVHEGKEQPIAYDFIDNDKYFYKSYKKRMISYKKAGCVFDD